jgi:hypothetical protein
MRRLLLVAARGPCVIGGGGRLAGWNTGSSVGYQPDRVQESLALLCTTGEVALRTAFGPHVSITQAGEALANFADSEQRFREAIRDDPKDAARQRQTISAVSRDLAKIDDGRRVISDLNSSDQAVLDANSQMIASLLELVSENGVCGGG